MQQVEMAPASAQLRPSVTISSYSTLKRIERQQRQKSEEQSCAELSTDFFKVRLAGSEHRLTAAAAAAAGAPQAAGRPQRVLIDLSQICGPTGSVRGHKNVVRRSLEGLRQASSRRLAAGGASADCRPRLSSFVPGGGQLQQQQQQRHASLQAASMRSYCDQYLERLFEEEQGQCVAYTTTLGVIRRTFEDSKRLKSILNLNLIRFRERDVYLNQEYKFQLKMRLQTMSGGGAAVLPALFVDGQHLGGLSELERMNESGELQRLLAKFKMSKPACEVCACCGNARFIACPNCNGSRKSAIHHFKFNSIALRCIRCDENEGLVACPTCNQADAALETAGKRRPAAGEQLARDENNNNNNNGTNGKQLKQLGLNFECDTSNC